MGSIPSSYMRVPYAKAFAKSERDIYHWTEFLKLSYRSLGDMERSMSTLLPRQQITHHGHVGALVYSASGYRECREMTFSVSALIHYKRSLNLI
jgi:hypothetical protein